MAAEYVARIGERIRTRREELGLTQEEVARRLPGKVTGQRVSLWERGEHQPRADSLEALAKALDVSVSYFLAAQPDKTQTPDLVGTMSNERSNGGYISEDRMRRLEAMALRNQQLLLAIVHRLEISDPEVFGAEAAAREFADAMRSLAADAAPARDAAASTPQPAQAGRKPRRRAAAG
jgi:transcriptional regulator with XRE-family HTH domain